MIWAQPRGGLARWGLEVSWYVIAILIHALALGVLPARTTLRAVRDVDSLATFEVLDEEAVPEQALEEEPVDIAPPEKALKLPTEPKPSTKEPPAPADEIPVDFKEMVLSNEAVGATWELDVRPDAVVTGRDVQGKAGGVVGGQGQGVVLELGDLSRQPTPPDLTRKLEKNYPRKAKAEGREGTAQVRLQINSDGTTSRLTLIDEAPQDYAFGQACLETLHGERWGAPADKEGRRVATRVTFTCRFRVRY